MKNTKNIAIIGTRTYPAHLIENYLMNIRLPDGLAIILLIGGHTASEAARKVAEIRGWGISEYLPNYARYKQGATHIRSKEMLLQADGVVTFWDGASKGTENEIRMAKKMGKKLIHCGASEPKTENGLF